MSAQQHRQQQHDMMVSMNNNNRSLPSTSSATSSGDSLLFDHANPVPKPMCGTLALAKLGLLPSHKKRRQFRFLRRSKGSTTYHEMPIELTPINTLFVTEQEFMLGNTSSETVSTADRTIEPIQATSQDSDSLLQFDTTTGRMYQVPAEENCSRPSSNTPKASNKADQKHFDFSVQEEDGYYHNNLLHDLDDHEDDSPMSNADDYVYLSSPESRDDVVYDDEEPPALPRHTRAAVKEVVTEDYADSDISTLDSFPVKRGDSFGSNSHEEMLLNMRDMIMKQQQNLEQLANKNYQYRDRLNASHGRVQELRKDHLDSMDSIIKLQFERESFEAEAVWLREELKNIRGELNVLKVNKGDADEQVLMEAPSTEETPAQRVSSVAKQATSEVRWSRSQSFLLKLKPVDEQDRQVVEEPQSPVSISSNKSETSLMLEFEARDTVWSDEELPNINLPPSPKAQSPKARSPLSPRKSTNNLKRGDENLVRFRDSVQKQEKQSPDEQSRPLTPKSATPQSSAGKVSREDSSEHSEPSKPAQNTVKSQSVSEKVAQFSKSATPVAPSPLPAARKKVVRQAAPQPPTQFPPVTKKVINHTRTVRFCPPSVREIPDDSTSYPSPMRGRKPVSPTDYFNAMRDYESDWEEPVVSTASPVKPKLAVQTEKSDFSVEISQPSSPSGNSSLLSESSTDRDEILQPFSPTRQRQSPEKSVTNPQPSSPTRQQQLSEKSVTNSLPSSPTKQQGSSEKSIANSLPSSPTKQQGSSEKSIANSLPSSPTKQQGSPRNNASLRVEVLQPPSPSSSQSSPRSSPRDSPRKRSANQGGSPQSSSAERSNSPRKQSRAVVSRPVLPSRQRNSPRTKKASPKSGTGMKLGSHISSNSPKKQAEKSKAFFPDDTSTSDEDSIKEGDLSSGDDSSFQRLVGGNFSVDKVQLKSLSPRSRYLEAAKRSSPAGALPQIGPLESEHVAPQIKPQHRPSPVVIARQQQVQSKLQSRPLPVVTAQQQQLVSSKDVETSPSTVVVTPHQLNGEDLDMRPSSVVAAALESDPNDDYEFKQSPVVNPNYEQSFPTDFQIMQAMAERSKAHAQAVKVKKSTSKAPLGWSPPQHEQPSNSTAPVPTPTPVVSKPLRKRGSRHSRIIEQNRRNSSIHQHNVDPATKMRTKQFNKAKRQAEDPAMSYAETNAELRWVKSQQHLLQTMKTEVMEVAQHSHSDSLASMSSDCVDDLQRRTDKVRMDVVKANLDATEEREGRDECDCREDESWGALSSDDIRGSSSGCSDTRESAEPREMAVQASRLSTTTGRHHPWNNNNGPTTASRVVPFRKNIFSTDESL